MDRQAAYCATCKINGLTQRQSDDLHGKYEPQAVTQGERESAEGEAVAYEV